jgi:hypothetical protein
LCPGGILRGPDGRRAVETIEFGGADYWTSDKMAKHLNRAIEIAQEAFPWAQLIFRSVTPVCLHLNSSGSTIARTTRSEQRMR